MASRVHLIRHGESTFNRIARATGRDPMHFDAPLTDDGRRQVAGIRQQARGLGAELVVTSPFTRAIETTLGLFDDTGILVEALHREHLQSSCDVGSSPRVLAEAFPQLAFDHLEDPWWYSVAGAEDPIQVEPEDQLNARVAAFRDWLRRRPETTVVVVGHGTFFFHMTGHFLENCEIHSVEI